MNFRLTLAGFGLGIAVAFSLSSTRANYKPKFGPTVAKAAEHEEANEPNENDPAAEDKELATRIKQERREGHDVSNALVHKKKDEAAMKAGNSKAALAHFEEGEKALSEGEEHEGAEEREKE